MGWLSVFLHTDQEGAEEDEGDKVEVGEVTSTFLPHSSRELITRSVTETRQHDLMPRLACRTPERHTSHSEDTPHIHWVNVNSKHCSAVMGAAVSFISSHWIICDTRIFGVWKQSYLKRRVKAWKKVWKLLWWFMAVSSFSSMFPNTWDSRRVGSVYWKQTPKCKDVQSLQQSPACSSNMCLIPKS